MDTNLIIIIAVVMVVLLIGVFGFQVIAERKKRKKIKQEKAKLDAIRKETIFSSSFKVNAIIEHNNLLLNNFVVSIGEYKMSEINNKIKNLLIDITQEPNFINSFVKFNDEKIDSSFDENIRKLIETKSNLWNKKINDVIKYFQDFENLLINDDETKKQEYLENKKNYLERIQNEEK